jgi:hypothetical protein
LKYRDYPVRINPHNVKSDRRKKRNGLAKHRVGRQ